MGDFEITRPFWLAALVLLPMLIYFSGRGLLHISANRRAAMLMLRFVTLLLIVAALIGIEKVGRFSDPDIIVAIDASRSLSPESVGKERSFASEVRAKMPDPSRLTVLEFARPVREVSPAELDGSAPPPDIDPTEYDATDIAQAIINARARLAADRPARIVVCSDGVATKGNLAAAVETCNVPLQAFAVPSLQGEIYVDRVSAPTEVLFGQPFTITANIVQSAGGKPTDIKVQLLKDGKPVATGGERTVSIQGGKATVTFSTANLDQQADSTNKYQPVEYTVEITEASGDTLPGNNSSSTVVYVGPKPRVLLLDSKPELAQRLQQALESEHIVVERRNIEALGEATGPIRFDDYDLVIISNVPATAIDPTKMESIATYVERGGGLIVIGGDQAFTPGGYAGTRIEEILPAVSYEKKDKPKPRLAMLLVLDQSGSMFDKDKPAGEPQAIELARQAARQAVGALGPRDQIGIIAFEDRTNWITELHPCSDKRPILEKIDTIEAGGGTNLLTAMEKAYLALRDADADLRHMIVLSDGLAYPGDFETLAEQIAAAGISVSTVAVGPEAAGGVLKDIAKLGNGHYYQCATADAVPQIFEMETISAGKVGITEGRSFVPQAIEGVELFRFMGEDTPTEQAETMPALFGFVELKLRPAARLLLQTREGDPVLASWKFGRGTSVVFASDIQSRWSTAWLRWNRFGQFWSSLVHHAIRRSPPQRFDLQFDRTTDDRAAVRIASRKSSANQCSAIIAWTDTEGKDHTAPMTLTAPGVYSANLDTLKQGIYHVSVTVEEAGKQTDKLRGALIVDYPLEWRIKPDASKRFLEIVTSGGTEAESSNTTVDEVVAPVKTDAALPDAQPLWPYFLLAAIVVMLLEIVIRRPKSAAA